MSATREPTSRKPWSIPIGVKLSFAIVLVTVTGALMAGFVISRTVERGTYSSFEDRLGYEATMLGQMTANALFGDLDPNDTSLAGPVRSLGEAVHTELAVVAKDGTVVAESETEDARSLPNQAQAPEIVRASQSMSGTSVRDGRMFVAHAIVRDGATLGYARSSVPMSDVEAQVRSVRRQVLLGTGAATVLAIVAGVFMASRLVRPIRALSAGARRVGGGDFGHRIVVESRDEIGVLAETFNDMTNSLQHTVSVLDQRNKDMRTVLDHVDQGLCTVTREGVLSRERSAIMDTWFGPAKGGMTFWDAVSAVDPTTACALAVHWAELQTGDLPIELLIHQLPNRINDGERRLDVKYGPIYAQDGESLDKMLIVVSDVTARIAAEHAEAEQRETAAVFERIMRDKPGVVDFFVDAESQVSALTGVERPPLPEVRRRLHTLKGNAAIFGMLSLSAVCHEIESHMAEENLDMSPSDRKVLADKWRRLATRLYAFVADTAKGIFIEDDEYATVLRALLDGAPRAEIARLVTEWKNERVTVHLERLADGVRQAARTLQKEIDASVTPSTARVPREEWAPFWGALVHAARNAADHGVESVDQRIKSGKSATGNIKLSAVAEDGWLVVRIADDGAGVDFERIRARARDAGLPHTTREDLVDALFADGVSSRDHVTETSGRGVGLAATKQECEQLGGFVSVVTKARQGTTFEFHVPLANAAPPAAVGGSLRPSPARVG